MRVNGYFYASIAAALSVMPNISWAHVKWFSRDANCAMSPLTPMEVIASSDFLILSIVAIGAMALAAWVDIYIGRAPNRFRSATTWIDAIAFVWIAPLLRWSLAIFFVTAVWYFRPISVFLTPELSTDARWVMPCQLSIAVLLLNRKTAWLAALGIVALYLGAIAQYGWFHLLDYPVFLGVAYFILMDSLYVGKKQALALSILRISAGVTLMWGGAEKWLYPWWSYTLLEGGMSVARLGFSSHFFMVAAGHIEFCAAFALAFGRFIPQIAALVLLIPFVGAIPAFGSLDAIGHAPIIVVLLILATTRTRVKPYRLSREPDHLQVLHYVLSASFAVLCIIGSYWDLHTLAYDSASLGSSEMKLISSLLVLPLLCWQISHWISRMPLQQDNAK